MTVKMGDVWERTTQVLSGRGAALAGIAALTLFLPGVIRNVYVAYATKGTAAFALVGGLLSLVVILISLWGQLAILALASDPATDRVGARDGATARLPAAIGVGAMLTLAVALAALPIIVAVAGAGIDVAAMANGGAASAASVTPGMTPGRALFIGCYGIAVGIAALFVGARLTLVNPIVLHERRGLGAIPHSWRLTRGHTWRILGVFVLFLIVVLVAVSAAQTVTGIAFRLILGADALATVGLLAGIAAAAVSTVFTVIALAFVAQLYIALAKRQPLAP